MAPVWWDNGNNTGSNFGLLNRKGLCWYFPTIVQAIVYGYNSATFPFEILNSDQPKISLVGGFIVNAGVVKYSLAKTSAVSLRLFNMQGKIISNLVQSTQSAATYELPSRIKGISAGSYILEFKAGSAFMTKRISVEGK